MLTPQGHVGQETPRACLGSTINAIFFFRHHRYIFDAKGAEANLQELGPRFTLKPLWMLAGGFDPKEGDYEWRKPSKANDEAASTRRSFML